MSDIKEKLDQVESCIKLGQFSLARTTFDSIKLNQIQRSDALRASNLARRCGKVKKSLKILNPIIRNQAQIETVTDAEKADYAFSLHRIGASFEANKLLEEVDGATCPSALFFHSLIAFSRWEYSKALPWLDQYIQSDSISDYQRLIGRSNRVNIYIFNESWDQAEMEVNNINKMAIENNFELLLNIGSEQLAQIHFGRGNLEAAKEQIKKAQKQAKDSGALLKTWIWKWQSILKAHNNNQNAEELLSEASQKALAEAAWEVARDIDYHKVLITNDKKTYSKLTIGTPFKKYIERIENKTKIEATKYFDYQIGNNSQISIDLETRELINNQSRRKLKLSNTQWKLIHCLLSDFYRPPKWGEIFNSLFPDEYFDPFTSINRLHQIVFRANKAFVKDNIPLKITATDEGCSLQSDIGLCFKVKKQSFEESHTDFQLIQISNHPNFQETFTLNTICEAFGGNKRKQQRWIKQMVEEGKILKLGQSRSTKYKLAA